MTTQKSSSPIVQTASGALLGREKGGVFQFNGIPYAAAPTGPNRFKRAMPVEPWDDIRDATRFGPAAPQIPSGGMTDNVQVKWNEDCLFLNVCTPSIDQMKRPVLVWIHGGAYRTGQGAIPWYNGSSFAANGNIVVVSINYRLGALGFTDLSEFGEDFATSGINGTLDQITALEWVRDNIENFGGDPDQVTIAGESAGGFSVTTLLGSDRAQGLFQRAIPQSGAAHHTLTKTTGQHVTRLFMEELNVNNLQQIQSSSVLDILEAQQKASAAFEKTGLGKGVQAFYPVEGNEVIPESLLAAIQSGVGAGIPVLTGTNKDEASLFILQEVSPSQLNEQVKGLGGGTELIAAYKKIYPSATTTEIAIAISTDFTFKLPVIRLAEARQAAGAETHLYQFDWESRTGHLKATHALEIPFTFNTLDSAGVKLFIGDGPLPQALADDMHRIWTTFIKGQRLDWPGYDTARRATMHFDTSSHLVENGELDILDAWQTLR
jgi:para-nitrobenzyl esterase